MRIAQLTDTFLPVADGVSRVVVAYAETLAKLGHQVTVSTSLYDTGYRGGFPFELVDYIGYKVPTAPQYKTGVAAMDRHYNQRMDMVPLDIVHTHSPFASGVEAARLARQRNIPLVSTFHSKYYDDFLKITHSETISKALIARVIRFFNRCDEVWAVSELSGQVLAEYGYKGSIQVMPNGTTLRETSDAAVKEVEEQFNLGDLPVFLYVGQMSWKKNILRTLEAASLLKQENPHFRLLLAGQGEDEKEIRRKIESLDLNEQAVMAGMISSTRTLDAMYKRARLFVFPSLYDNSPLVVREAASMATPSVVLKGSCTAEAITDRQNGFLCLDQAESLLEVLKTALIDQALIERVGEAAQKTIPISWEKIMQDVVSRYEGLIQNYQGKSHSTNKRYQRKKAGKS